MKTLCETAKQIAAELQVRATGLQRELLDVQARAAQIKAEMDAVSGAPERLANYTVEFGGDYQCPRCWIISGTRSPLKAVPGGTTGDLFRCRACNNKFTV